MPKLLTLCPMATWTVRKSNPVNTANINQMPPLFWQGRHFIFGASPHNSRLTAQAPLRRLRHGICVAKMLDNVGFRYPHRASGAKAPRTLRPLPLLRFAVSATGGARFCLTARPFTNVDFRLKTVNSNRITEISDQGPSAHQNGQKHYIGNSKHRKIVPFFSRYFICNLSIRNQACHGCN